MTGARMSLWVFALGVCLAAASCGPAGLNPITDPPAGGSAGPGDDPDTPGGTNSNQPDPTGSNPSNPVLSVGDVTDAPGTGGDALSDAIVTARVRNESNLPADVTLRFIADQRVVLQAFVRVLPGTITSVGSPRLAETLEVSGTNEEGSMLQSKTFVFGVDFDEHNPAEYLIPAQMPDDDLDPDIPPDPDDLPPDDEISSITFVKPAQDVTVAPGTEVIVEWVDESTVPDAVVDVYVRRTDVTPSDRIPIGVSISVALDGPQDELLLDVDGLDPGSYEVIGELDDHRTIVTAVAPGLIHVITTNLSPELKLTDPARDIELRGSDTFRISWTDSDDNDNARIALSLEPDDAAGAPDRPDVPLISDIEEDNDTDEVTLTMPPGVAKGAYRVKGEITDGSAAVVSWAPGIIFFGVTLPQPPEITIEPFEVQRLRLGDTIDVQLLTTNAPAGSSARLKLTNLANGGTTMVTVLDELDPPTGRAQFALVDAQPPIANLDWPRQFDLIAELVTDTGQVLDTDDVSGSIWIRQEVEISDASVNYICDNGQVIPTEPTSRLTVGITITWMGGGFEQLDPNDDDRELQREVRFWLSQDGMIPLDGRDDASHLLIHTATESPNVERLFRVPLSRIASLPVGENEGFSTLLEEGFYSLMTIVETDTMETIISIANPDDPIEICLPAIP